MKSVFFSIAVLGALADGASAGPCARYDGSSALPSGFERTGDIHTADGVGRQIEFVPIYSDPDCYCALFPAGFNLNVEVHGRREGQAFWVCGERGHDLEVDR